MQTKAVIIGLALLGGHWTEVRATSLPDWVRTSAPQQLWSGVACSADGSKIIAGSRFSSQYNPGAIYVSADSGRTWQLTSAPIQYWDGVAASADGTRLLAFGSASDVANSPESIYLSTNSGATWTPTSAPGTTWNVLTSSADGSHLAAAIWYGGIYYSTNGGATWSAGNAPTRYYQALTASADGQRLAASGGDVNNPNARQIYLSTDAGATWTPVNGPTNLIGLACSADGNLLLGAAGQTGIFLSSDAGQDWQLAGASGPEWSAIASSREGLKAMTVAGGMSAGAIYATSDGGKSWQQSGTITGYFNSIACSSDGTKWVASEGGYAAGYIYTLQTSPALQISLSSNAVLLSWPGSATGYVLEQSPDPGAAGQWLSLTNSPQTANGKFQVSLPLAAGRNFFRLKSQ